MHASKHKSLVGLGACPPEKKLIFTLSEVDSNAILESNLWSSNSAD